MRSTLVAFAVAGVLLPGPAAAQSSLALDVDATQAPMKILHVTVSMSARSGPTTLFYPKWIPGEHMPSGPIAKPRLPSQP